MIGLDQFRCRFKFRYISPISVTLRTSRFILIIICSPSIYEYALIHTEKRRCYYNDLFHLLHCVQSSFSGIFKT